MSSLARVESGFPRWVNFLSRWIMPRLQKAIARLLAVSLRVSMIAVQAARRCSRGVQSWPAHHLQFCDLWAAAISGMSNVTARRAPAMTLLTFVLATAGSLEITTVRHPQAARA